MVLISLHCANNGVLMIIMDWPFEFLQTNIFCRKNFDVPFRNHSVRYHIVSYWFWICFIFSSHNSTLHSVQNGWTVQFLLTGMCISCDGRPIQRMNMIVFIQDNKVFSVRIGRVCFILCFCMQRDVTTLTNAGNVCSACDPYCRS